MRVSPLNLQSHLKEPSDTLDVAALFNVLLIICLLFLLSSRFIVAPGMTIDLPSSGHREVKGVLTAGAVLTAKSDNLFLFEGNVCTLEALPKILNNYIPSLTDASSILLVKLDRNVSVQAFVQVADMARDAGFSQVQIALQPRKDQEVYELMKEALQGDEA